eukprot:5239335-Pyramimonas_sp.AAC.1
MQDSWARAFIDADEQMTSFKLMQGGGGDIMPLLSLSGPASASQRAMPSARSCRHHGNTLSQGGGSTSG